MQNLHGGEEYVFIDEYNEETERVGSPDTESLLQVDLGQTGGSASGENPPELNTQTSTGPTQPEKLKPRPKPPLHEINPCVMTHQPFPTTHMEMAKILRQDEALKRDNIYLRTIMETFRPKADASLKSESSTSSAIEEEITGT